MSEPATDFIRITADRMFDGLGGAPIANGGVLIQGSEVVRIGASGELRTPEGANIGGRHYPNASILPGFVDAHTHVTAPGDGTPGEGVGATDDGILLLQAVANV